MICFNKIAGVCLFLLIGLAIVVFGWGNEKVRLKDVQVLTLHAGRQTSYRRGGPVPQLKCMGGSAGCRDAPDIVQCKNSGSDGSEVQWECKAEMPSHTTFGRLNVNCEGYDYPGDKDILKGSCGLEYYLERSKGKSSNNDWKAPESSSRMANLIGIAIILLVIYGFYRSCLHQPQYSPTDDYSRPQPGSGGTYPSAPPPPPGFRSDYYSNSDSCSGNARRAGNSEGPGFWTGAAGGGLLGYLFGSNNSGGGYTRSYGNSGGWGSGSGTWGQGNRSTRSRSGSGSSTHAATGFGGTTVR